MERSIAHRLAARALAVSLIASALVVAAIAPAQQQTFDEYSDHRHGAGHGVHGQLALAGTTACLNAALTEGRNNNAYSGIAAAVVLDGRIVYHSGFGTVSPTSTQPVLPSTRFRSGSVLKSMTATALLTLVQEGRVRLHAPVNALLPGLELPGEPGWSDELTAHLLLSQQGAIADTGVLFGPRDDSALAAAFYDPAFLQTVPLMVRPGTFYNYSNPNFSLAGLLAETAAGKPYRYLMRQRVLKPLGMTRTTFLPSEVLTDNDFAYGMTGNIIWAPNDYDNSILRPAGFAWTTVDDLAKYLLFLIHGNREVLSPRLWRTMQTQQVDTQELLGLEGYGYGLVIDRATTLADRNGQLHFYDGVKAVSHGGAIAGYTAFMVSLPAQRFGYVTLVNGDSTNPLPSLAPACFRAAAAETISDRLPPPSPFPAPDIQRDRFIDYVGHYSDRINLMGETIVTLTPAGDLHVQLSNLDAIGFQYDPILQPILRDNFLLQTQSGALLLTGIRGSGNQVEYLRTRVTVISRTQDAETTLRAEASMDRDAVEQGIRAAARESISVLELNNQ